MAGGSDKYLSDAEKIAFLQGLDAETLSALLGGNQGADYGDALARITAMGGDALTAAQDFITDVESGLPYNEVKKNFEAAVSKGIYNLDTDTADEVSKSVLTALTNKQKGGGSSSVVKMAKELGFPELALLAPSLAQQRRQTANPYEGVSETAKQYMTDMEGWKSQKLKESGGQSFLRNALKIGGTAVGGLAAGMAAAAAAPVALPAMIGLGVAGGGLGALTSGGILSRIMPDSSGLKEKKKEKEQALKMLQSKYDMEQRQQSQRQAAWQKGYEETINKSGGGVSPYDIQKLQMISLLKQQG